MVKFKEGKLPIKPEDRFKYLYKFQEELRIFHNKKAEDMRKGKITEAQFRRFQIGWFDKRNNLICGKIVECKSKLSEKEKEKLLEIDDSDEQNITFGAVKNKEKFKRDKNIKINIEDIEEG